MLGAFTLLPVAAHAAFPADPPNDPRYDASPLPNATNEQWDLTSPAGGFDRGISVDRAWPLTTGEGVVIADLDVGVQLDHPDLIGRWLEAAGEMGADGAGRDRRSNGVDDDGNGYVDDWRGWDFYGRDSDPTSDTSNNHGTNVAGVLGAATDNGVGIAGIAPGSRLLPLRTADNILHQGGRLAQAIVYAADRGADVISMSLGADSFGAELRAAVRYAHRKGVVMAVASGNEFHFHHHYPQLMGEVLAVGGVNPDTADLAARDPNLALTGTRFDVKASYSDYGAHLDLMAPVQVPTTDWGSDYSVTWSGTSAAAPHVAGTAALVIARGKALGLDLSADEVIQILRQTADDLTDAGQGFRAGWDRLSGWGRVNAFEAVSRVAADEIPPVARISSPEPYAPEADDVAVRGVAHGRSAANWTLEIGSGQEPSSWRRLATGSAAGPGETPLARIAAGAIEAGEHTLRLRVSDANGNGAEDRLLFRAVRDSTLARGYPLRLGTSGESSPLLVDLDCDGGDDVMLATADGRLRALSGRTADPLPGWPAAMDSAPGSAPTASRIGTLRAGFIGTPAVGDIAGDARAEVVAAGLDGKVYAFDAAGKRLAGFPFAVALARPTARLEPAVYSSPALADLDRDGKLDVVFGAADQRIYAIDGGGHALPGWPVLARDGGDQAKILSSPAIADLDGDGSPEVVEGTAEAYGTTPNTSGRVYAFSARGARVPGWPVKPPALAADAIPLVGEGVPVSPAVADVDGDGKDEVAVAAFTGQPELFAGDGTRLGGAGGLGRFQFAGRGSTSPASSAATLALGANAVLARTDPGGAVRLFGGLVDARLALAQQLPATRFPFEHLVGGWDAATGRWLDAFPAPVEGWTIAAAPGVADVDGDGRAEVLAGSSGNVLHALRPEGGAPPGWPKATSGWLLAAPAAGDLDGDGRTEVVAVTRDGYLFAWRTAGRASARPWPFFRHDARNTGNLDGPTANAGGCPTRPAAPSPAATPSDEDAPTGGMDTVRAPVATREGLAFTGLWLAASVASGMALMGAGAALLRRRRR